MIGEIATLIYVVLTAIALLASIVGVYVKINSATEKNTNDINRIESHYTEQLKELKERNSKQDQVNQKFEKNLNESNKELMLELKKYEEKISVMYELLQKVNITMEMIVSGKIQTK